MKIKMNLVIIFFLILMLITKQVQIYLLLMLFAALHEIGHIVAGLIVGFRTETIEIIPSRFFS